jgi:hypothetical protein
MTHSCRFRPSSFLALASARHHGAYPSSLLLLHLLEGNQKLATGVERVLLRWRIAAAIFWKGAHSPGDTILLPPLASSRSQLSTGNSYEATELDGLGSRAGEHVHEPCNATELYIILASSEVKLRTANLVEP